MVATGVIFDAVSSQATCAANTSLRVVSCRDAISGQCTLASSSARPRSSLLRHSLASESKLLPKAALRWSAPKSRKAVTVRAAEWASEAEKQDWERRKHESGGGGGGGEWRWTLNWNYVSDDIIVGSCPRSPSDVDRIVKEAGATAILNLQSDTCFEALQIPFPAIRQRAVELGVRLARVPIRDFDHGDQATMLPQAVRLLNLLLHSTGGQRGRGSLSPGDAGAGEGTAGEAQGGDQEEGARVYVHCTAGINRASLTALSLLTFVRGMPLEAALNQLRSARPIVHPYLDSWHTAKGRLLVGRGEEQMQAAKMVYEQRQASGQHGDAASDWRQAEVVLLQRSFARMLEIDLQQKVEGVRRGLSSPERMQELQQRRQEGRVARQLQQERAHTAPAAPVPAIVNGTPVAASAPAAAGDEAPSTLEQQEDALRVLRWRVLREQMAARAAESEALQLEMVALVRSGQIKIPHAATEEEPVSDSALPLTAGASGVN